MKSLLSISLLLFFSGCSYDEANHAPPVVKAEPALPFIIDTIKRLLPNENVVHIVCPLAFRTVAPEVLEEQILIKEEKLGVWFSGGAEWSWLRKPYKDQVACCAAYGIVNTVKPRMGWPPASAEDPGHRRYMAGEMTEAKAAATMLAPIAEELAALKQATRKVYARHVIKRFYEQVDDWFREAEVHALFMSRDFRFDRTVLISPLVHVYFYTPDGYAFEGSRDGAYLSKAGVSWYGRGYLKDHFYTINVIEVPDR